jgi:ribosomal protein S18 acetylase RimI-like enzyme
VPVPGPKSKPSLLPEPREVTLRDLRSYRLRPLAPGDEERLIAFFSSHTAETIRQRYGYLIKYMSAERAHKLVDLDPTQEVALGLLDTEGGQEVLHAVGRMVLAEDGRTAEVAFVVRETKRRLGMASTLLRALVNLARARRLDHLFAQVQNDNGPMLAVFRKAGGKLVEDRAGGIVEVTIPLRKTR